jgi:hypothetical protein
MEHRRFSRILFSSNAQLELNQQAFRTSVLDLSLKGALVAKPEGDSWPTSIADDTTVILRFFLNDSDLEVVMTGTIAHSHEHSIGLRCELIDIDSVSHLRRLLELNMGDAELLGRELSELTAQR